MKKFMFAILSIVFCASAFGDCETITTGKWKFGCDSKDNGANREYKYNTYVQTVGASHCHNQKTLHYNRQWLCEDTDNTSDDQWKESGENWCSNTKFKNPTVPGALYSVYKSESLCAGPVEYNSESNSNGCAGGCLYAECPRDQEYDRVNEACIPTDKNAYCKESSVVHNGVSPAKELKTGTNTYLYCYTANEFAGIREENKRRNSCLAWKSRVPVDGGYQECTDNGWVDHDWDKCSTSDFNDCNGIDNCVSEVIDSSTNKRIVSAGGTAQEVIFDSGKTFCVRYVCAEGFTKVDGKCVAESVVRDNEQRARNAQQSCVSTGGEWKTSTCICAPGKNLERDGNTKCRCKAGYEYIDSNNKSQGCKKMNKTMMKEACDAASDASWDVSTETCVCNMGDNYVFNYTQKKCLPNDTYAACQKFVAAGNARWDNTAKVCTCTKKGFEFDGAQCVETAQATAERLTREATQTVNSVYSQLTSIHNKFRDDVSVWKNEEGKFNTARLASDSIAGVVLGTAGGLITSSVVKKNQVENGFEDIKCTIGGQNVAEWGDQFRVGIQ